MGICSQFGGKRIFRPPEHRAHIGRVMPPGVEIGVFADKERQMQRDIGQSTSETAQQRRGLR
jgi:hypothetical protein